MAEPLWQLDAVDVAAGIREGTFSARDAVTDCIARCDTVNGALNAITELRADAALDAADAADRARADGQSLGALHGVPVTIKGNVDVAGWPTVNGCAAFADNIAQVNSPFVQQWIDAGAIVIGRTNTPEFSVRWETNNDHFGATTNPWDPRLTPGGSSGGAAASLAVGVTPLASGTDLGGSLRQPAQACGVASLRPGRGRIPDFNPTDPGEMGIGFQLMNVNGPMARRVGDVRLAFEAMCGADSRDPWWVPLPPGYTDDAPHRVAVALDPAGSKTHPQVRAGLEQASRLLADAGYDVDDATPPRLAEAVDVWRAVCVGELLLHLEPAVRDFCGHQMRRAFECYRNVMGDPEAGDLLSALALRRGVLRDWLAFFDRYPLIIAPVSTLPPMPRDADIATDEGCAELFDSLSMVVAVNALGLPAAVVPVGVADGLPQVVQIIGPPFAEARCLDAAQAIEDRVERITPIDPRMGT